MKRIIALLLSLVLCCGIMVPTSLAADKASEVEVDTTPEELGTLSFESLEQRVRENNLTVRMLQATIDSIDANDYEQMKDDLRDSLNQIAKGQQFLIAYGQGDSYSYAAMDQMYSSLRETFDDLKDGDIQQDSADAIRQLQDTQNQVIAGAESLYIALLEMQNNRNILERKLASTNRTVQEMQTRYNLGQISALQLRQVKDGRVQIQSGLDTLNNSIEGAVIQLEMMVGADITGKMTVTEVPAVTDAQVDAINYAADLDQVRQKSYDIYAAKATLDEAEEAYKDAKKGYGKSSYQWKAAEHKWQAAQYTYQAAVQAFEAKFRACCSAVTDYRQILRAKESALALQKDTYRAMELKYRRGMISKNDYLAAKDDLAEAQDAVTTAQHNLFTAYSAYDWAVRFGVLN